jgi:hypothetical protein
MKLLLYLSFFLMTSMYAADEALMDAIIKSDIKGVQAFLEKNYGMPEYQKLAYADLAQQIIHRRSIDLCREGTPVSGYLYLSLIGYWINSVFILNTWCKYNSERDLKWPLIRVLGLALSTYWLVKAIGNQRVMNREYKELMDNTVKIKSLIIEHI